MIDMWKSCLWMFSSLDIFLDTAILSTEACGNDSEFARFRWVLVLAGSYALA